MIPALSLPYALSEKVDGTVPIGENMGHLLTYQT